MRSNLIDFSAYAIYSMFVAISYVHIRFLWCWKLLYNFVDIHVT